MKEWTKVKSVNFCRNQKKSRKQICGNKYPVATFITKMQQGDDDEYSRRLNANVAYLEG